MRKTALKTLVFTILVLFPILVSAKFKDTLRLDLALHEPGSVISVQGNRSYDVLIIENTVAGFSYSLEISNIRRLLPALSYDPSGLAGAEDKGKGCINLFLHLKDLQNFQEGNDPDQRRDEKVLGKIVRELKAELQKKSCNEEEVIEAVHYWLGTTQKVHYEKIKAGTGDEVTAIVRRDSLEWTFIFKGNESGQWVTTYGFGFTSSGLNNSIHYSKAVPDTTVFQILKAGNRRLLDLNYVPAIFFSYFPSQRINCWLNHSVTAGLGFDLSAPVVFLGYNLMYRHNIGLSTGIAFQQQYILKDQYSENEIITTALDKDQLHDKIYRPNFFVSINFRFGGNPFTSRNIPDTGW